MKNKHYFCVLFVIVLLFLNSIPVLSHAGKTDANGGHYNRSTGEYHYHHGYPAHSHTDGKCPYDFDDQTDHSSKNPSISESKNSGYGTSYTRSSGAKSYLSNNSSNKSKYKNSGKTELDNSRATNTDNYNYFLSFEFYSLLVPVVIITLYYGTGYIKKYVSYRKYKKHISTKAKKAYLQPLIQIHNGMIPQDYAFDEKLFPHQTNVSLSHSKYAVYTTLSGSSYHKANCRVLNGRQVKLTHIYIASKSLKLRPCSVCKPQIPQEQWLNNIKDIINTDREFYSTVANYPELLDEYLRKQKERAEAIEAPKKLLQKVGWSKWDNLVVDDKQLERYNKGITANFEIKKYDYINKTAVIKSSSGRNYVTNPSGCSCSDFMYNNHNKAPCKHIYFLAKWITKTQTLTNN